MRGSKRFRHGEVFCSSNGPGTQEIEPFEHTDYRFDSRTSTLTCISLRALVREAISASMRARRCPKGESGLTADGVSVAAGSRWGGGGGCCPRGGGGW